MFEGSTDMSIHLHDFQYNLMVDIEATMTEFLCDTTITILKLSPRIDVITSINSRGYSLYARLDTSW